MRAGLTDSKPSRESDVSTVRYKLNGVSQLGQAAPAKVFSPPTKCRGKDSETDVKKKPGRAFGGIACQQSR